MTRLVPVLSVACVFANAREEIAVCQAYIACVQATDPANGAAVGEGYGADSGCWEDPISAERCGDTCTALLVQQHLAFSETPACALDVVDLPHLDEAEILWRTEVTVTDGTCGPSGFLTDMVTVPSPEGFFLVLEDFVGDEALVLPCTREGQEVACLEVRAPTGQQVTPTDIIVDPDVVRMALTLDVAEGGVVCGTWRVDGERR